LSSEENNKDLETLEQVQRLHEGNKAHDILFKVQDKKFPAHKNILSLRSSFFSNTCSSSLNEYFLIKFQGGMQESHGKEINIPEDISSEAFKGNFKKQFFHASLIAFLEYVYTGTLPSREDILKELMVYSEKILLEKLRVHCERTLANRITKENVVGLYELSMKSAAEDLKKVTLQFMGNHLSYFAKQLVSMKVKALENVV